MAISTHFSLPILLLILSKPTENFTVLLLVTYLLGGGSSKKEARSFANKLNTEFRGWLKKLPPCPVKEEKCKQSSQFEPDGLSKSPNFLLQVFHPGAYSSYRSKPQDFFVNENFISRISQQCTYASNGNLITKGPGAGTPDFAAGNTDSTDLREISKALDYHNRTDVKTWCALGWQEYNKTWVPDDGSR